MPENASRLSQFTFCITLVVCALAIFSHPSRAQENAQVLVLFDSSGSMWGKLKDSTKTKFETAANSLNHALSAPPGETNAPGLIIFGGRCTTANLIVPPGLDSKKQFVDQLARLNPKGKGPISLALETAAKSLPKLSNASVVLIHDGPDNCRRDPCQAAQDFAKSHKGVPIHLVSIALPKAARIATACVAKLTGGTVTQVETAEQLDKAIKTAMNLAIKNRPLKKEEPKTAQSSISEEQTDSAKDKTGPSRMRLSAKLGPKGKTLKTPIRWQVFKSGAQPSDKPLLDIAEAQLTLPIAPATYNVVATLGQMQQNHSVTVPKVGAAVLDVIFDAGQIRLSAPDFDANIEARNPMSRSNTIVTLKRLSPDNTQPLNKSETSAASPVVAPLVVADGGESVVILPTGKYAMTIEKGRARSQRTLSVTAGQTSQIDLNLGTGQLILDLSIPGDDFVTDHVLFKVFVDDPDSATGRREIARTTSPNPSFILPAGTYYISAHVGYAQQKARAVVSSGTSTNVNITLLAAQLSLKTNLNISSQRTQLPIQYRITRISGVEQEIALSGKQNPNFILSPGKYRIVAEIGARNVSATAEVDLPAGSNTAIELNPRAAEVILKLSGKTNASTINRFWIVRDQTGAVVWRSNAYAPSALLAPGIYEVSCETRNGKQTKSFELTAGESKSIELIH